MQRDEQMMAWLVVCFLGGWLGLSLVYQLFMHRLRPYVRRFDIFWVLPAYRFFEKRPDYFILSYRDRSRNGVESPWQDLQFQRPARWYTFLWHPQFIPSDTIVVSMEHFADMMAWEKPLPMKHIQPQFPYQALLRYVTQYSSPPQGQARQFRILRGAQHFEDDSDTVIFVSDYHDLSEA